MKIPEFRHRIRQDFLDINEPNMLFEDGIIDRAVLSAVEDFSRLVPYSKYHEIVVDGSNQSDDIESNLITDTYEFQLTSFPIKFGSETVEDENGVTYTRTTDWLINYNTGVVTFPTGSALIALANGITVTFTYVKSRSLFPITLPDLRAIQSVDLYSGSLRQEASFNLIGDYLLFNDRYEEVPDTYRINLLYYARHTPPDDNHDGTVPEAAAELIIKGAEAILLFSKAISLELEQSENFNDLSDLSTFYALITTDLASARAALVTALARADAADTSAIANATLIASDFTAQDAAIAQAGTFLSSVDAQLLASAGVIDAEVITDILLAISLFNVSAGAVITDLTAKLASAYTFIDTEVNTDLGDAKTAATTLVQGYLDSGDDFIEPVNPGKDPAEYYRKYAETAIAKASANIAVGEGRLKLAEEYVSLVKEQLDSATAIISQAKMSLEAAGVRLALSAAYGVIAKGYVDAAIARLQQASIYNERIAARLAYVKILVDESGAYIAVANGYQQNAQILMSEINAQIAAASEVRQQGIFIVEIAERLRAEANRRYSDFKDLISSRAQTLRQGSNIGIQMRNP
jgi:hypothetical protein